MSDSADVVMVIGRVCVGRASCLVFGEGTDFGSGGIGMVGANERACGGGESVILVGKSSRGGGVSDQVSESRLSIVASLVVIVYCRKMEILMLRLVRLVPLRTLPTISLGPRFRLFPELNLFLNLMSLFEVFILGSDERRRKSVR